MLCIPHGYNNPVKYIDPSGHISCEALGTEECNEDGGFVDNDPLPGQYIGPPVSEWEKQLLAIAAFVEMHGHGFEQAVAIIWIALNRVEELIPLTGNSFHQNLNFSDISDIAGYVLSAGQFAIGQVIAENYGLLQIGEDYQNWEIVGDLTLQQVISLSFEYLNDYYDGEVEVILGIVNEVISDYYSGGNDPTFGSVYYGHVSPEKVGLIQTNLEAYANSLNVSNDFEFHIFPSTRDINPITLIVNNLTFAP